MLNFVSGYAENHNYCPFCGTSRILYSSTSGMMTCEYCKAKYYVIEDDESELETEDDDEQEVQE